MKKSSKTRKTAVHTLAAASLFLTAMPVAGAATRATSDLFAYKALGNGSHLRQTLSGGKSQLLAQAKSGEKKCGEGKCGKDKKAAEGKCGEGKCGEGKCGKDKKAAEGKCGEGKCGEGHKGDAITNTKEAPKTKK